MTELGPQRYVEDLEPGMSYSCTRVFSEDDVKLFADLVGDHNPIHMDEAYAKGTMYKTRIVHGAFVASLLSGIMGTQLPGPGAIFRALNLNYRGPVKIGEEVTATVEVEEVNPAKNAVKLKVFCQVRGLKVVRGDAVAWVANRPKD